MPAIRHFCFVVLISVVTTALAAGRPERFALDPRETCAGAYLTMQHGTDVARIRFPGHADMVLDFRY
jgi:hypothetical protein